MSNILDAVKAGALAAGREAATVPSLTPRCRIAVMWGAGHPDMLKVMRQAVADRISVITWDGAYWHRGTHYRFSVNAPHPEAMVMSLSYPSLRFERFGVVLRNHWSPAGPIILVGMGAKCARMYDEPAGQWERDMAKAIRERFPGRSIHFRPRPVGSGHCKELPGCTTRAGGRIEDILRGASLVVCRHSNVAVDAIVAGIPVVSEGGAAAAVCPRRLEDAGELLPEKVRRRFLANLAYFQWSLAEMRNAETWRIIEDIAMVRETV